MSEGASSAPLRALLLHGVPTDGALWDGVRAELSGVVLAPDLPGFGDAPALALPTPEAYVRALAPLIDADTHLVGHDYGGLIAAMLAERLPVRSLVLCSTALGPGWAPARLTARWPLNRFFYRRYAGRRWLAMGVSPDRAPALLARYAGADPALMEAIARHIPLAPPPRPACPTLCLWGAEDRSMPVWQARLLARGLDAPLTLLPGLRHYAMWEDPVAFAAVLRRFWGELVLSSRR